MSFGWEGDKVRLVPLDKARHFDNAVAWMNDPEVTAWTLIGDWPMTRLGEQEFFDVVRTPEKGELAFAVETLEGEHIGFTGIHKIDLRHGVGTTGTILGRKDLWRRGYGLDTARVRTRYAFEVVGLRLLLSEAFVENAASIRILEKVGYREVGRIAGRYFKRGGYRDVILFAFPRP